MPDVAGKFYLSDFVQELKDRGFDGFGDAALKSLVNRGYFHVARKAKWYWQETSDTFTLAPGSSSALLWPAASGELPYFRSLDKLYVTTANQRRKLEPLSDDDFFNKWFSLDLTAGSNQGEPSGYYIFEGRLYILPPPNSSRDFLAHYTQRAAPLMADLDQPLTPQHLDEAILVAAEARAHARAKEVTLKTIAEADLAEFFDDMKDDETELMGEQQERVSPDDGWY